MTAKKFFKLAIILAVSEIIFTGAVLGMLIDPYNVFHIENLRENGIEPNKNYIKMNYILKYPERFNTFLFGSSKVGAIHTEKMHGERCYNMTYSGGLPSEHLANIRNFLKNGIHIDRIYMGVDSYSYTLDPETHLTQQLRAPYEHLHGHPVNFMKLYMDPSVVLQSVEVMLDSEQGNINYDGAFYKYGAWASYDRKKKFDWSKPDIQPSIGEARLIDETLEAIKETVNLCRKENIEITVFVNPMHYITYRASLELGHLRFLEALADITDFYNFGGFNDVGMDNNNFYDTSHYTPEVGDMIIDVIHNGKKYDGLYPQGFGWKVTRENIKEFLSIPEVSGKNTPGL